jgi:hypothetical protein
VVGVDPPDRLAAGRQAVYDALHDPQPAHGVGHPQRAGNAAYKRDFQPLVAQRCAGGGGQREERRRVGRLDHQAAGRRREGDVGQPQRAQVPRFNGQAAFDQRPVEAHTAGDDALYGGGAPHGNVPS